MSVPVVGIAFVVAGILIFLYIIFRESFLKRFLELSLAFILAFLLREAGFADDLAYFALGLTVALAFYIRKI